MEEFEDLTERELQEYQLKNLVNLNKKIDNVKNYLVWIVLIMASILGLLFRDGFM